MYVCMYVEIHAIHTQPWPLMRIRKINRNFPTHQFYTLAMPFTQTGGQTIPLSGLKNDRFKPLQRLKLTFLQVHILAIVL